MHTLCMRLMYVMHTVYTDMYTYASLDVHALMLVNWHHGFLICYVDVDVDGMLSIHICSHGMVL